MKIDNMEPDMQRIFLLAQRIQEDTKAYREEFIDVEKMDSEQAQELYDMIMEARKGLHMAHVELAPFAEDKKEHNLRG